MKKLTTFIFCCSISISIAQNNTQEKITNTTNDVVKIAVAADAATKTIEKNKPLIKDGGEAIKNIFKKKNLSNDKTKSNDSTSTNIDPANDLTGNWKGNYSGGANFSYEMDIEKVNDSLYLGISHCKVLEYYGGSPFVKYTTEMDFFLKMTRRAEKCVLTEIMLLQPVQSSSLALWRPKVFELTLEPENKKMKLEGKCTTVDCPPIVKLKRQSNELSKAERERIEGIIQPNIEISGISFKSVSGSDYMGYLESGKVSFNVLNKSQLRTLNLILTFYISDESVKIESVYGLNDESIEGGQSRICSVNLKSNDRILKSDFTVRIGVKMKGASQELAYKEFQIPVKQE